MKNESYTPDWVIQAVRQVLGAIELDPTSNGLGNIAKHQITIKEDCFWSDWRQYLLHSKTVFLNPPYSNGGLFVKELVKYCDSDSIHSAISLTLPGLLHNKHSSFLFKHEYCSLIALPTGRINFDNNSTQNPRDSMFTLWTKDDDVKQRFIQFFKNLESPENSTSRVRGCLILQNI